MNIIRVTRTSAYTCSVTADGKIVREYSVPVGGGFVFSGANSTWLGKLVTTSLTEVEAIPYMNMNGLLRAGASDLSTVIRNILKNESARATILASL